MGTIGVPELIVIFVIALIVFGPKKLPELGKSLGKGLAEFRKASNDLRSTIEEEVRAIESDPSHSSLPEKNSFTTQQAYSEPIKVSINSPSSEEARAIESAPPTPSSTEKNPVASQKPSSELNVDAH
jgi:TatA/E family protein of Tat protein translocase